MENPERRSGCTVETFMLWWIVFSVLLGFVVFLYLQDQTNRPKREAENRLLSILNAAALFSSRNAGYWPTSPTARGFYGDFSASEHFTYAQLSASTTGRYVARATGNGTDGVSSRVTVTISAAADWTPTYMYAGW